MSNPLFFSRMLSLTYAFAYSTYNDKIFIKPGKRKNNLEVRIKFSGFPSFEEFIVGLPNMRKGFSLAQITSFRGGFPLAFIDLTGSRSKDERGLRKSTSGETTWHHHEVMGIMMLIDIDFHESVRHPVGAAVWSICRKFKDKYK